MQHRTIIAALAIAFGSLVAVFSMYFKNSQDRDGKDALLPADQMGVLTSRLERLEELSERQSEILDRLENRLAANERRVNDVESSAASAAKASEGLVNAGVKKEAAATVTPTAEEPALTVEAAIAKLADPNLSFIERETLWNKIRAAGILDDVIALYEKRVADDPKNPDAHTDLGDIYLQKIQEVGQTPLAGVWATKADKAFDKALELDNGHWRARFEKAMSLSFWPEAFGKRTEAIKNFEVLAEQQKGRATRPEFAQTYLILGNLYSQSKEPAKAVETWRLGLSMFPDNEDLRKQIDTASH